MTRAKADETSIQTIEGSQDVSLPSPHIRHSEAMANELRINEARFQSGKVALTAQMEGITADYSKAEAERKAKHDEEIAALLTRIEDMNDGIAMCAAALDKAGEQK